MLPSSSTEPCPRRPPSGTKVRAISSLRLLQRGCRRCWRPGRTQHRAGSSRTAAFADEPKGVLRLIRLPEETEDRLEVDAPLLAPLELMLRKYPPSLIVVVHKEHAQTFASILDEMIPQHHVDGVQVKHIRSGGNKNPSLQRKEENRVKSNMAAVVRLVDREVSAVSYKRLYVAGPDEAVAELERLLPPSLKKIIAGRLSASLDLGVGELGVHLRAQLATSPAD